MENIKDFITRQPSERKPYAHKFDKKPLFMASTNEVRKTVQPEPKYSLQRLTAYALTMVTMFLGFAVMSAVDSITETYGFWALLACFGGVLLLGLLTARITNARTKTHPNGVKLFGEVEDTSF